MRLDKKIMKYIAGLLCIVLLLTAVFPQVTVKASSEQNIGEASGQDEKQKQEQKAGTADADKDVSEQKTEKEPVDTAGTGNTAQDLNGQNAKTEGTVKNTEPSTSELKKDNKSGVADSNKAAKVTSYTYEDDSVIVKAELSEAGAVPSEAELRIRTITDSEEQKDRYESITAYLTEKSNESQFVIDGFMAFEIYFVYDGEEILPSKGDVSVSVEYKQENVPDAYLNSTQEGKEVKLYQLQEGGSDVAKLSVADMKEKMTGFTQTSNGGVDEMGFVIDSYLPLILVWQQAPTLTFDYNTESISATATVAEMGILPEDAILEINRVDQGENFSKALELAEEKVEENGQTVKSSAAYDINVKQGVLAIQPEGIVEINIDFINGLELDGSSDYYLFHLKDDGTLEEVSAAVEANENVVSKLNFQTDGFSLYLLVSTQSLSEGEVLVKEGVNCVNVTDAGPLLEPVKARSVAAKFKMAFSTYSVQRTTPTEEDTDKNGVVTKKSSVWDDDSNTAKITLESYTTGKVTGGEAIPADIVLVLDQSGSMDDRLDGTISYTPIYRLDTDESYWININGEYVEVKYRRDRGGWYYGSRNNYVTVYPFTNAGGNASGTPKYQFYNRTTTQGKKKLEALQDAAYEFINSVQTEAVDKGVDHRIAVVGFARGDGNNTPHYLNTELFIGSTQYGYNNTTINSGSAGNQISGIANQYRNAFQNVNTTIGTNRLNSSIGALTAQGATRADLGLDMANSIFAANPVTSGERNRVIVMFTDGEPNNGSGFGTTVANNAITKAKEAKNTYGATVYSVGVIDGINPSVNPTTNIDKYMHYVSSNYPNATSLNSPGAGDYQAGYYLSANNAQDLSEIFKNISDQIGTSNSTLDENAVVVDYISDSFKVDGLDYKIYTADYLGNGEWAEKKPFDNAQVVVNSDDKTVSVSNFDYSSNYTLEEDPDNDNQPSGKKLIIELSVAPIDGFVGGNAVPTNTHDTAIFEEAGGSAIEKFPYPDVDVPLQYDFEKQDVSIYIGDVWNQPEKFFNSTENGIKYTIGDSKYVLGGAVNQYVDITYTITDKDGKTVGTYTVPAGAESGSWSVVPELNTNKLTKDETYTVNASVKPVNSGTQAQMDTSEKEPLIHVFKPSLQVSDTTLFYGDTTDLERRIDKNTITWACEHSGAAKPEGSVPVLTYDYKLVSGSLVGDETSVYEPSEDSDFKLIVKKGDKDITTHTTIKNTSSTHENAKDHDFTVYLVKGQLDIYKQINENYTNIETINANQNFVFKIERRDSPDGESTDTYYVTINFDANKDQPNTYKSESIFGLKKGFYTVTEETSWSSKYVLSETSNNYNNAGNAVNLYIGDEAWNGLSNPDADGKYNYYGTAVDKAYQKVANAHVAEARFTNKLDVNWKWLSDVASALNKFIK